ncbi:hypothetical protein [Herbaspirillum robiniae]|uniref:Preprotein translocase subunit TatA n=1 Tax=Herbaspirillum robiniae TaxID=2014887 RepID=A0ABX2LWP9_9BURK|nr:hypothetical protein [Herbaspirillum robiniae]NUU00432.1 hypothetical protein [Herbaspirillum robiniae]
MDGLDKITLVLLVLLVAVALLFPLSSRRGDEREREHGAATGDEKKRS